MPWVHDVSTDTDNPPPFIALREFRLKCRNGADYSGLRADEHRRHHPDLQPDEFEHPPSAIFNAALAAVNQLHWNVVAAVESEGRIEATATTRLLRFKDDVVIRIRANDNDSGTRLDIRSASRVGSSDFGVNAKRIRTFLSEINSRLKTNT